MSVWDQLKLEDIRFKVCKFLANAQKHWFKPGIRLTFVMRDPTNDECYIVLGDDELPELKRLIEKEIDRDLEKANPN